jgi:hypothetical protein
MSGLSLKYILLKDFHNTYFNIQITTLDFPPVPYLRLQTIKQNIIDRKGKHVL